MRIVRLLSLFLLSAGALNAQVRQTPTKGAEPTLPNAEVKQDVVYTFDVARPVELFDAVADGSLWFAVDVFGVNKTITINGVHNETQYSQFSPLSTQISPNGKYMIWMGITHTFDQQSFNTSTTTVFRHDVGKKTSDSVLSVHADHDMLYFSQQGDHWAALMPASNVKQEPPRDLAVVDGRVVASGNPNPKMFTFSPDASTWAYRSRDGRDENLITPNGKQTLFQRATDDPIIIKNEPLVMRFSPDLRFQDYGLDGRDFDFMLRNVATLYSTSYINKKHDTTLQYIVYGGKRQLYSRWIKDILIAPQGKHIVYFASDTTTGSASNRSVVVKDGNIIAGPYESSWRLFMSPSGEHIAWTVQEGNGISLYLDGKKIGSVGEFMVIRWSNDERTIAYATSDSHEKIYVVAGGKRSTIYDRIGRLGISADAKTVEYMAVKYDKLLHVKQRF
ncbi:MAG: hypothetical protein JSS75_12030 [Bacteroidetes bacterium]|nr:hypothetical protein [Bacteroidota bacterium]